MYFNPRHHAGGDGGWGIGCIPLWDFNPRHHAGGDKVVGVKVDAATDFNPRHHAGGDRACFHESDECCHISIHATTQVATTQPEYYAVASTISIHATTQVAT